MQINVTTFNIRCDHNQDRENSFCYRAPLIKKSIEKRNSDIIGFQEVLPHVFRWLQSNLKEYNIVGCGRDVNLSEEHMIIAYKRDRFELLDLSTMWLSETPNISGSRFENQSLCPRTCTIAILRESNSEKLIRVYVTHLDHETDYARQEGLKLIINKISEDQENFNIPSILMGDFNEIPEKINFKQLTKNFKNPFIDCSENSGITFHSYYNGEEEVSKIDYIWATSEFKCEEVLKWEECENGVYLSDHYPVESKLHIE